MKKSNHTIDQTLFDLKLNEAKLYLDQGLVDEADQIYETLLNELHKLPETKTANAQIKQLEAIRKEYQNKHDRQADPAEAGRREKEKPDDELYTEAMAFMDLESFEEAVSIYKTLIQHEYRLYEVMYSFILCCKETDDKDGATEYLESLTKDSNASLQVVETAYYYLSVLHEEQGNYIKSLQFLNSIESPETFYDYENRQKSLKSKIKGKTKFDYLLAQKIITDIDLKKAENMAKKENRSVEYILLNSFSVEIDQLGKSLSMFYGYPFIDLTEETTIKEELFNNLKYQYLKSNHWAPLAVTPSENKVEVAIDNPEMQHQEDIRKIYIGHKLQFYIAVREHIDEYIDRQYNKAPAYDAPEEDVSDFMDEISGDIDAEYDEGQEEEEEADVALVDSKVIMFVNKMIVDAYRKDASDIHIEPSTHTKNTDIRFRIDGICQPYIKIPNSFSRPVISRIKIMARMDITEKRRPLDGKVKFKSRSTGSIELRVATIPTSGGNEDVVMRLLAAGEPMKLKDLGVLDYNLDPFLEIIKKPYGMILVVGPTGSGKTTTLHSALNIINTPEKKIWTAEDPVEIDQKGIRQSEVHPKIGLDFAALLRSFLRADPDVIMVGEMRDNETTKTGIEASLTGHLVYSTLHTNNAPETITRLLEMDIDPANFGDSLLGILAQRLGRRLCSKCKQESENSKEEVEELFKEFGPDPLGLLDTFDRESIKLYHPKGCNACGDTGYKGRIGFHELLINNEEITTLIKEEAAMEQVRKAAIQNNMYTLKQDGFLKVLQGITDVPEVNRNCV
ncbi:MAG: ATPase, T2SS/T4P/T4SS family [Thermodesulfobacteriota bacterium]